MLPAAESDAGEAIVPLAVRVTIDPTAAAKNTTFGKSAARSGI